MAQMNGYWDDMIGLTQERDGTTYEVFRKLLAVLKNFVAEEEIAVVYPRMATGDPDMMDNGLCLELIVFAADGSIIVASMLDSERFEIIVTNKTEVCSLNVSGYLADSSQEMMPALSINFKDGSKLDLNSEEDANDYWGEKYPELIKLIITQLRS